MTSNSAKSTLIFDDQGNTWKASSLSVRQHFGLYEDVSTLSDLMVRNMGFAAIQLKQKSTIVYLRPSIVSHVSLASLMYWLADNRPIGIVLKHFGSDQHYELINSLPNLGRRLSVLMLHNDPNGENFKKQPVPADSLKSTSPFFRLLDKWSDGDEKNILHRTRDILRTEFDSRFLLARLTARTSDVEVLSWGKGYLRIPGGGNWLNSTKRKYLGQVPDYTYGQWVTSAYRSVAQSRKPITEQIEANIYWKGLGRVRRRYMRIILPCILTNGNLGLLSTTCTSSDFGIHVKAA